jgi:formate dehydrogenase major subunit
MGQKDKEAGRFELSRRDFLKVSAAGAAAATVAGGWAPAPAMAEVGPWKTNMLGTDSAIDRFHTTCPYCSASCGQVVAVGHTTGEVYDIYGDVDSPINNGGLCAKGAGAYQLVNNTRRLGVPEHTAAVDGTDFKGMAWRKVGDNAWDPITLNTAFDEIAGGWSGTDSGAHAGAHLGMVAYRDSATPVASPNPNSKNVMFFGSSHVNNEANYLYRKVIANFGTTNVEHQARI